MNQLLAFHEQSGNGATVLTTILDDPTGYGRIIRDSKGNVLRIVEQKDANSSELAVHEVNTSVYVFDANCWLKRSPTSNPTTPKVSST